MSYGRLELHQTVNAPAGSIWTWIDPEYRMPVLILYLALIILTIFWPKEKGLGELISLSAALLVASQFWYLDAGGTLVLLYLPLILLMMFRPHLIPKRVIHDFVFRRPKRTTSIPIASPA